MDLVVFELGAARYGLPCADVRELHRAVAIVPLPDAPPIVEGIINLRGTIVPVLDIRARFRLEAKPLSHADYFVIARAGDRTVALRVDRGLEVVRVPARKLERTSTSGYSSEYASGVAKLEGGLVLIHDLQRFLDDEEGVAVDRALFALGSGVS